MVLAKKVIRKSAGILPLPGSEYVLLLEKEVLDVSGGSVLHELVRAN